MRAVQSEPNGAVQQQSLQSFAILSKRTMHRLWQKNQNKTNEKVR